MSALKFFYLGIIQIFRIFFRSICLFSLEFEFRPFMSTLNYVLILSIYFLMCFFSLSLFLYDYAHFTCTHFLLFKKYAHTHTINWIKFYLRRNLVMLPCNSFLFDSSWSSRLNRYFSSNLIKREIVI